MVWYRTTQGDLRLAPRPIHDRQPADIRRRWANGRTGYDGWALFTRPTSSRHYPILRAQVEAYAHELALRIDTGWQPPRPSSN